MLPTHIDSIEARNTPPFARLLSRKRAGTGSTPQLLLHQVDA